MAVDKNKITAEATKLVQKGQWDKAIKAYERILAMDPKDVRVLLKVGELHQKKGDNAAAAQTFNHVADAYSEQGFFLKAVAVYKQIVRLAPDDIQVNQRLAGLYKQLGLMSDAMLQLQLVAQAYEKAGEGSRLIDVLRSMVELDPENIASSIKLGELYAKAGQAAPALEQFRGAADYLKKNKRTDEYLKVAERIAFLAPNDTGLTRELANLYLAKGDTKRALAKLQLCFKADPRDIETLNLLAQAFNDLGQASKTISVFKELAQVYAQKGRQDDARATWRRIAALAPDDPEAKEALSPAATPPPAHAQAANPPPQARPAPPPQAPSRPAGPEAIPRLLTETDVYLKYGLHDRALDHLNKIFAVEPDNPGGHEKARDIHVAAGNREAAADEALKAARGWVTRGLSDRAQMAVARLREIAPRHPELGLLAAAAGLPSTGSSAAAVVPPPALGADDLALAAAGEEGEEIVADELPGAVDEPPPRPADEAGAALALDEDVETISPDEIEVEQVAPRPPARAPASGPPPGARAVAPRPSPRPPPPAPRDKVVDLSDELEEADFFVQQGLVGEAREALQVLLAAHPGHGEVVRRVAALEKRATPPAQPHAARSPTPPAPAMLATPPAATGAGDESFDIARELAQELGGQAVSAPATDDFQYSVEDVFNQFKKGVAETVKPEDSETHYDLGIAYKEMGLLEDAIHEFEVALGGKNRRKEVDSLTMIGLCRRGKGEHRQAVQAFRRALQSDHLTPEAARALHYELGLAHAALGESDVALWYFQKIAKADPRYRDVKAMVERLGGGPGRAPADDSGLGGTPPNGAPRSTSGPAATPVPKPGPKKNIGYV